MVATQQLHRTYNTLEVPLTPASIGMLLCYSPAVHGYINAVIPVSNFTQLLVLEGELGGGVDGDCLSGGLACGIVGLWFRARHS